MNRAVFLDRDGVIVRDSGYVYRLEDLELLDGAADAIKRFNSAGFLVIVVSNQSGVARGYFKEEDVEKFNMEMARQLEQKGAGVNGIYFCPHHPDGKASGYDKVCDCRKPASGMLIKAAKEYDIDLKSSWMIGDMEKDINAGKGAGCRTILIEKNTAGLGKAAETVLDMDKLKVWDGIKEIAAHARKNNKKIVFTNGCFDILHAGHIHYLRQAKELGDLLIIGLNSDRSVKKIKGSGRPVNSELDRAYVLAGLECVDRIVIFDEDTPIRLLEEIKPAIHVKGGDWKDKKIPEQGTVEKNGGRVVFIEFLAGHSTTKLIERMKKA